MDEEIEEVAGAPTSRLRAGLGMVAMVGVGVLIALGITAASQDDGGDGFCNLAVPVLEDGTLGDLPDDACG